MKKIIYCLSLLLAAMSVSSCSDFFDPDTDDELNGEDYISSDTEMYTGFLGIMTKLQAIGDKEILLTDTRGEVVEVSDRSIPELIAIYNYDEDLSGNSYANPAGYYEVVIACNDYLAKMKEYRNEPGVDADIWSSLVSSTVRIKAWIYKTLAEIYGEAVWFDDPVTKVTELTAANGFQHLELAQVIDKCMELLDNGYEGVSSDITINWIEWLDPENVTSVADSKYRKWNYMVPPYAGIYAELCLWKAATIEALAPDSPTQDPAATVYYQKAVDLLFATLNEVINTNSDHSSNPYWIPSAWSKGKFSSFYDSADPVANENVAALIYDYANNQTNTLLKHFSNEYPNEYLLRPNAKAIENFLAETYESDSRYTATFKMNAGEYYIAKFRPVGSTARANAYQDDVHIYIYRSQFYHLLLAEGLNHLDRFEAMDAVFNSGFTSSDYKNAVLNGEPGWEGFTRNWTAEPEWASSTKYYHEGIRNSQGCPSLRKVVTSLSGVTAHDAHKTNDLEILGETMLSFCVEGKVYPMMNRMALRYRDPGIIADRVAPKYESAGKDAEIRGKILSCDEGPNWVKYDLMVDDLKQAVEE